MPLCPPNLLSTHLTQKPAVDKSVERVQTKLASMLNRLELEIQSVEKRIGDKMHVLDRDSDGMVSAEEIAHVVQHVLATESTAREAKAIAEDVSVKEYFLLLCFPWIRFRVLSVGGLCLLHSETNR